MKRILLFLFLSLSVFSITESMAQGFALERTWSPVLYQWRFDSLETDDDSALAYLYLPFYAYVKGMNVISGTGDTADFRLVSYTGAGSAEVTALDSVRSKTGGATNVGYNNMNVALPGGVYRINFIHRHTGGASAVEMRDVLLSLWVQLITGG